MWTSLNKQKIFTKLTTASMLIKCDSNSQSTRTLRNSIICGYDILNRDDFMRVTHRGLVFFPSARIYDIRGLFL